MFTDKEIELMKLIGLNINFEHPSGDDWVDVEEIVGDYLMYCGFDDNYEPNEIGWICEGIIDKIPHD